MGSSILSVSPSIATPLPSAPQPDVQLTCSTHQTFHLRAYCTREGYRRLDAVMAECATLYNAALQEWRDAYRMQGKSITLYDQHKGLTGVARTTPKAGGPSTGASAAASSAAWTTPVGRSSGQSRSARSPVIPGSRAGAGGRQFPLRRRLPR